MRADMQARLYIVFIRFLQTIEAKNTKMHFCKNIKLMLGAFLELEV